MKGEEEIMTDTFTSTVHSVCKEEACMGAEGEVVVEREDLGTSQGTPGTGM